MTRLRVLLLAGSSADARLITEVLRAARATSIDLVAAASLPVALNHLRSRHFDAILLGPQQIDAARADAIQAIRALDADAPIVILSADDERLRIETPLSHGQEDMHECAGNDGQLVQAIVDAVERANAQKALRASERRYREFIERCPAAIFQADLEGRLTLANPSWLALHGYPRWPTPEPMWPDTFVSPALGHRLLRRVVEDGRIRDVEAVILRRDGTHRTVLLSADTVPASPDGQSYIEGTLLDISDRRHAQNRFASLLRGIADPLLIVSREGKIVFANERASELFGYAGAELRGQPIAMLVPESHELDVERYFARPTIRALDAALDLSARRKDGSVCPVDIALTPLDGSGGRLVLCTVRDRSDRLKLEAELRRAREMQTVGRVAAGAAREIDGVLTAIAGHLRALEDRYPERPDARECLRPALDAVNRGSTLVRTLREFSRRRPGMPRRADLNELLTGMEPLLQRILAERVVVRLELAAEPCVAHLDPAPLKLAILSLVLSVRSTAAGICELVMSTATREVDGSTDAEVAPGDYVILRVDYQTAGRSRSDDADDLAELAPCILHAWARRSGGYARFRTDRGLAVDIYLRRAVPAAMGSEPHPPPGLWVEPGAERVLVVDADPLVRDVASSMLKCLGYDVATAASGTQALELLAQDGEFALLLTDIMPGGMSGAELVRRAREFRPGLGVAYTTAYPDTPILSRRAFHDGDKILAKPYSMDDLAKVVREVLT